MNEKFSSREKFSAEPEKEAEYDKLNELIERREMLQQRWGDLFDEKLDVQFKYPSDTWFKNKKFDLTLSFITNAEDRGRYLECEEGMESIDKEKDELDKEVLEMQFDIGLEALESILLKQGNWKEIKNDSVEFNGNKLFDFKEWEFVDKDKIATMHATMTPRISFKDNIMGMATFMNDKEVLSRVKKWPEGKTVPYNDVKLKFSVRPRLKWLKTLDINAVGNIMVSKSFGFEGGQDNYRVDFGSDFGGNAFPNISKEKQEKAISLMKQFTNNNNIDFFAD